MSSDYHRIKSRETIDSLFSRLSIAQAVGDVLEQGTVYGKLGNAFARLGDFEKAINYLNRSLCLAKNLGDKASEGHLYCNLGSAFCCLGDFKKAVEYFNLHLSIVKDRSDKAGELMAYDNLGKAFDRLGDFQKAIHYHSFALTLAKYLEDKVKVGRRYSDLGIKYYDLGDFKNAAHYLKLHLSICKDLDDKREIGSAYCNLGNAFQSLGDSKKAAKYFTLALSIAKDLEDKATERAACNNLGNAFFRLGDFKKAIHYHNLALSISKDLDDKAAIGISYGNLGNAFKSLGDIKRAIEYYKRRLSIAKGLGDKDGEGGAYCNLGLVFCDLGEYEKAINYHNLYLSIAKDLGDKAGEAAAYGNLGIAFDRLGDARKAITYHNLRLNIAKDLGDKAGEGRAYGNLGLAFFLLCDFKKAVEYHSLHGSIAKDLGDKVEEAGAYLNLGNTFQGSGDLEHAVKYYQLSVRVFNDVRSLLQHEDGWKIGFRNLASNAYTGLWISLLKQDKIVEALFAAEEGRAQALADLIESRYAFQACQSGSQRAREEKDVGMLNCPSSCTVFLGIETIENAIDFWVLLKGKPVFHRKKELGCRYLVGGAAKSVQSLIQCAYDTTGVHADVRCENRSLNTLRKGHSSHEKSDDKSSQPLLSTQTPLVSLYNNIIGPIADLVQGDELIIVPDGPLWLAPYAALMASDSKYLCESFRIRVIPSLTSLKMIADCPSDYHSRSGALLVGDPCLADITDLEGERILEQLPFARQEVQMIGQILKVTPLTGKQATKDDVLKQMSSVALVHIAAHGSMETGEIALSPNPARLTKNPTEEDFLLTMADVMGVKLRARLVVLSCCHSGRGEIKAEGVVGIARAFMGAGARSVLVSLWAIDDEATLEFMKSFYHHLADGRSSSESLNQAMKSLRESDKYNDVKYWAPFVLIGDDVTL